MHKQSSVVGGTSLILLGLFFLALQFLPEEIARLVDLGNQWPLLIVAVGGVFLLGALLVQPPLAIPGTIIAGVGLLLYYQNLSGNWASWAYAWTLIPGFVGLGIFLMHLRQGTMKQGIKEGGRLMITSLGLFLLFGLFFSGFRGLLWPVGLIVLGLMLLMRNVWRGRG